MRGRLDAMFRDDLTASKRLTWRVTGERTAVGELDLGRDVVAGVADLREDMALGQNVAAWTLEGSISAGWAVLATGTTIGYRRLVRFESAVLRRLRLTIEDANESPRRVELRLYRER
jgi:alpha-L-fucosidase